MMPDEENDKFALDRFRGHFGERNWAALSPSRQAAALRYYYANPDFNPNSISEPLSVWAARLQRMQAIRDHQDAWRDLWFNLPTYRQNSVIWDYINE